MWNLCKCNDCVNNDCVNNDCVNNDCVKLMSEPEKQFALTERHIARIQQREQFIYSEIIIMVIVIMIVDDDTLPLYYYYSYSTPIVKL